MPNKQNRFTLQFSGSDGEAWEWDKRFALSGTKPSGAAREGYSKSLYTLSKGKELFFPK